VLVRLEWMLAAGRARLLVLGFGPERAGSAWQCSTTLGSAAVGSAHGGTGAVLVEHWNGTTWTWPRSRLHSDAKPEPDPTAERHSPARSRSCALTAEACSARAISI